MPTFTPAPAPALEFVQPKEGLYQVCRRYCPGRWTTYAVPPDLEEYAREVARINSLDWPDPALSPGQRIRMPPCP